MRYVYVALLFLTSCTFNKTLQKNKAIAEAYYQVGEYANAIVYYQKIHKHEQDIYSLLKIVESYQTIHDYDHALEWALKINQDQITDSLTYLKALLYKSVGKYELAKNHYELIYDLHIDTLFIPSCDSALLWRNSPNGKIENLSRLNSEYSDNSPMFYNEGMVFASSRDNPFGKKHQGQTNEPFFDIYKTRLTKQKQWTNPISFSSNINSARHEGALCFNHDESILYFTRSSGNKYVKERGENVVHLKLFKSIKGKTGWKRPESFMLNDSVYSVGHPTISEDGQVFIFSSDMPGGHGGVDLYITFKVGDKWKIPVNLGPEVNTIGDETYPFLTRGGKLFFSSNGHLTMGGFDVFSCQFKEGTWTDVKNLKFPVNSSADDFSFILDENGKRGIMSSNRLGGKGKEDLYQVVFSKPMD